MPLTIRCPKCGKELVAPDELLGKVAACPQCNLTFPVTGSGRGSKPPLATPSGPPAAVSAAPVRASANPVAPSPLAMSAIPTNVPPPSGTTSATTPPPPPPDVRGSTPPPESIATNVRPETRPPKVASTALSSPANGPLANAVAAPRSANAARFITANPTERRIDLGADGRLPELVLQEGAKTEQTSATPRATNPLVLVAVLAVSFGLTAAMLLLDTESRRTESELKAQARDDLALHYTRSYRRLEPYQEQLRQALQFHNQGKYAEERGCYRRVLDLLHEEHRENLKGLTGVRHGTSPPNDEHLESLLSQLLSND